MCLYTKSKTITKSKTLCIKFYIEKKTLWVTLMNFLKLAEGVRRLYTKSKTLCVTWSDNTYIYIYIYMTNTNKCIAKLDPHTRNTFVLIYCVGSSVAIHLSCVCLYISLSLYLFVRFAAVCLSLCFSSVSLSVSLSSSPLLARYIYRGRREIFMYRNPDTLSYATGQKIF